MIKDNIKIEVSAKFDELNNEEAMTILERDYAQFESYLDKYKRFSKPVTNIFIKILPPLFGVSYCGYHHIKDGIHQIQLYGMKKKNLLIHELTHCFFPSEDNFRYHEGFADYLQNHETLFNNLTAEESLAVHIKNKNFIMPENIYEFWKDEKKGNHNDVRGSRAAFARSMSRLFTGYLIEKFGEDSFFNDFFYNPEIDSDREKVLFDGFLNEFGKKYLDFDEKLVEKYDYHFIKMNDYIEKWKEFYKYGASDYGHPVFSIMESGIDVDDETNEKISELYVQMIKDYHNSL